MQNKFASQPIGWMAKAAYHSNATSQMFLCYTLRDSSFVKLRESSRLGWIYIKMEIILQSPTPIYAIYTHIIHNLYNMYNPHASNIGDLISIMHHPVPDVIPPLPQGYR